MEGEVKKIKNLNGKQTIEIELLKEEILDFKQKINELENQLEKMAEIKNNLENELKAK